MKILVAIKRVRDPERANRVTVNSTGDGLVASQLDWKINPFDEHALEAALRLTEDGRNPKVRCGEVVIVTFGPAEGERELRFALALGANRALRIDATDELLDGCLVACGLAVVVREEKPDLVILGKQTVDMETNQVGQMLAEFLDWPMATCTTAIFQESEENIRVVRQVDGGTATLRLRLPAVLTVDLGIVACSNVYSRFTSREYRYPEGVRYATLPAFSAAKRKSLSVRRLDSLLVQPQIATRYVRFRLPTARSPGRIVSSAAELIRCLGVEAKVLRKAPNG